MFTCNIYLCSKRLDVVHQLNMFTVILGVLLNYFVLLLWRYQALSHFAKITVVKVHLYNQPKVHTSLCLECNLILEQHVRSKAPWVSVETRHSMENSICVKRDVIPPSLTCRQRTGKLHPMRQLNKAVMHTKICCSCTIDACGKLPVPIE